MKRTLITTAVSLTALATVWAPAAHAGPDDIQQPQPIPAKVSVSDAELKAAWEAHYDSKPFAVPIPEYEEGASVATRAGLPEELSSAKTMPGGSRWRSLPFGPCTSTASAAIFTDTPFGSAIGFFPIRDKTDY